MNRLLSLISFFITGALLAQSPRLGDAPIHENFKPAPSRTVAADTQPGRVPTVAAAAVPSVNVEDREAVRAFYTTYYVPEAPMNWTGNITTGVAGTTSDAFKDSVVTRINFYRALGGIPANVTLDAELSRTAQLAALMFSANNALSHEPPATWTFYSAEGAAAAARSNIAIGLSGVAAIDGYMEDVGDHNAPVGHRRWILHPKLVRTGTGDIPLQSSSKPNANAMRVVDGTLNASLARTARDNFVAWPYRGYIPHVLVPARFSISFPASTALPNGPNVLNAQVQADQLGTPLEVTIEHRTNPTDGMHGEGPAIVFSLKKSGRSMSRTGFVGEDMDKPINIRITGVQGSSAFETITYAVIPFNAVSTNTAPVLHMPTTPIAATAGTAFSYQILASGAKTFAATGLPPGLTLNTTTGVISGTPSSSGNYTVSVTASNGQNSSGSFTIAVTGQGTGPTLTLPSSPVAGIVGSSFSYQIVGTNVTSYAATGLPPGLTLNTATGLITGVPTVVGNYTVSVTGSNGQAATGSFTISISATPPPGSGGFVNLATRGQIGSGASVLIAGFYVDSDQPKTLLIRGVGPDLASRGIPTHAKNITLNIADRNGNTVAANTGWSTNPNATEIAAVSQTVGADALDAGSGDSAVLVTLGRGPYTAVLSTPNAASEGVALVEIFDASSASGRLSNIATRGEAGAGADSMIAGFFISGSSPRKVLVRAVGRSLIDYGVPGRLVQSPKIQIVNKAGQVVLEGGAWRTAPNSAEIQAAFAPAGAPNLDPARDDAALVTILSPGSYTAIVTPDAASVDAVCLVEIFEVRN